MQTKRPLDSFAGYDGRIDYPYTYSLKTKIKKLLEHGSGVPVLTGYYQQVPAMEKNLVNINTIQ